jgi:hypothetical protein
MHAGLRLPLMPFVVVLLLAGCAPATEPSTAAQAPEQRPVATPLAAWPASLNVMGDGFPSPGDACRRIGESEATVDYLDHTATLAGCLSVDDANRLGGTVVATVDGVTLVSLPVAPAIPGDGDGQGDALVAGTLYHATAQIPCAGYQGATAGMCKAGVVRATATGTYVEVALPGGAQRTLFFNGDGSFLAFSTAEADGTASMETSSRREGDTTIAMLGTERYEIPDAFVKGD